MHHRKCSALILVAGITLVATAPAGASDTAAGDRLEMLSKVFHVDRIYRSMEGPYDSRELTLGSGDKPELMWITGMRTEIVGADGKQVLSSEYVCHVNLDLHPVKHSELFGRHRAFNARLMTLSQGQFSVELPQGFGIPVMSDEPLTVVSQVLNHNHPDADLRLRHKITVNYVRDTDLKKPLRPLYVNAPFGMKLLNGSDGYFGLGSAEARPRGPGCLPGQHAANGTSSGIFNDEFGRRFSGHWKVKPGREVNHTPVNRLMQLPYNTTIHYIAIHLHPFAEYVELNDLTARRTVFRSRATPPADGIGLARVETFSSVDGIPVYAGHQYELVSVYNNTSGRDQDAMATMLLYMLDKEFENAIGTGVASTPGN
jgi:hypothetical protein